MNTQTNSGRNKTLLVCEDNFLEKNNKKENTGWMASNVSKITVLTEFQNNKLLFPIRQLEGASLSYYKKVLGKNMSSFAKNYYIFEINEIKEIKNSSNESSLSDENIGQFNKR